PHNTAQLVQLKGSLMILVGAGVGTVAVVLLIQRWLPGLSTLPEVEEAIRHETLVDYDDLVGTRGRTTTKLLPSGKARFDDRLVDVIADCEMVERGCEVEVVEVRGNRVFVRPIP
ncbi:MAG: NfeD family protein, partial [Thermoguttaceae bacterium]|nr:NfeD family protein [Thermoguttaceae bacterium]